MPNLAKKSNPFNGCKALAPPPPSLEVVARAVEDLAGPCYTL